MVVSNRPVLASRTFRRWVNAYFLALAAVTLPLGLVVAKYFGAWTLSDWLINYQGGFVRRGLAGEIAFRLAHLLHVPAVVWIVLFYLALYAAILVYGRRLVLGAGASFWVLAVMLSPAAFAFHVVDLNGGFRKEILFVAWMAWLLGRRPRREMPAAGMSLLLTGVLAFIMLTHEPLICYVPYLAAALLVTGMPLRKALRTVALPMVVGVALALVTARFHGDENTARAICASIGHPLEAQGKGVCQGGSVQFLANNDRQAHAMLAGDLRRLGYWRMYPVGAVLALLPLVLGSLALARAGLGQLMREVWAVAAMSFAASGLLFYYAGDWGRWIFLHAITLSLLLLAAAGRRRRREAASAERSEKLPVWTWGALAVYATLWSVPHFPGSTPPYGYIGTAVYVRNHLHSIGE